MTVNMMQEQNSLKKNAFYNALRQITEIAFPLITFPYASRIFLPEGLGKIYYTDSIIRVLIIVATFSIGGYAIREAARIRDNKEKLSQFTYEMLVFNCITTGVSYLLFFILFFFVKKLEPYRSLLLIQGTSIFFTTFGMEWLYTAMEDYKIITVRSIIFRSIGLVLLFTLVHSKDDILLYAFTIVFPVVATNICNFIFSRKYVSFQHCHYPELKKHFKPAVMMFSMTLTISVYTVVDSTMLGFLSSDREVGLYTAATKITKLILSVISSLYGVLFPRLSYLSEQKNTKQFDSLLQNGLEIVLCLSFPCAIGLALLAKPIIMLFSGDSFMKAIPIMRLMTPLIIIITLGNIINNVVLIPLRKENLTLCAEVSGAVVNVTLNAILIPRYGAMGAGIATVIAETIITLLTYILGWKYVHVSNNTISICQYLTATIGMGLIVYLLNKYLPFGLGLNLVVCIVVGASIYGILLVLLKNKFVCNVLKNLRYKR